MIDYASIAQDALDAIKDAGLQLVIRRYTGGAFDPVVGAYSGQTTTSGTIDAVVLPIGSGKESFDNKLFEGLAIDKLRFLLVAAKTATFEPRATDEVDLESVTWSVLGVVPLNPNGTPLIYKMAVQVK